MIRVIKQDTAGDSILYRKVIDYSTAAGLGDLRVPRSQTLTYV